jgi:hypothetical protein
MGEAIWSSFGSNFYENLLLIGIDPSKGTICLKNGPPPVFDGVTEDPCVGTQLFIIIKSTFLFEF